MIIKRGCLFITIVLLLIFSWQSSGAASKNDVAKKKNTAKIATATAKKSNSSQLKKANRKTKKSLRAKKKHAHQVAQERPAPAKDAPPLIKITPLENGKFLLEPMDSSLNSQEKGADSLSLLKSPVLADEQKEEDHQENSINPLMNFPNLLVEISKQLLGKSYRLGGNGQGGSGIDCSGFVKKIYQSLTLSLPHSSREQAKLGSLVTTEWDLSQLRIGDLLFFKRKRGAQIGHTGMYIGDGKMIHSASKKGVVISNLKSSDYYNKNFVMAKRLFILSEPAGEEPKEKKETKESQS